MAHQWILLAVLVSIATALPTKPHMEAEQLIALFNNPGLGRNSLIENLIIDALEDLRETMLTGTDDIPVLDPLQVAHISADDSIIPIPGAHVEINDLLVTKLSTFEVQEVSVVSVGLLRRYNVQVQVEIPLVDVDVGQYDLSINVWGLNFFGRGDAKISATKPWIKIDADIILNPGFLALYLNITDLRIGFGLADIQIGIVGMFNDPSVDDFVNRFLRNLILELAEFWVDDISDIISPIVMDVANDILSDINLIGIL